MPYKLKDTGVTLKYLGKRTTQAGASADVLELTFKNVGRTPENKYHVYVDDESRLVTQWDYYPKASDPEPRFQLPWLEWERHGAILLSASRGERQHEDVAVLVGVPDSVFESPDPIREIVLPEARLGAGDLPGVQCAQGVFGWRLMGDSRQQQESVQLIGKRQLCVARFERKE